MSSPPLPEFARAYLARFDARWPTSLTSPTWEDASPVDQIRFVVLDSETTGLDPRKDRLITIGAVAVRDGEIHLADAYEAMLKIAYNSASVTVHGITRHETREALDEPDALTSFLEYLGDGVIVGHHIMHDIETLNAGYERHFGFTLRNRHLDTMDLALHLQQDGAFAEAARGPREFAGFSLDALCDFFGVAPHDRHTAGGDAFITALVFLRLLHFARRVGRVTLGALAEPYLVEES